MVWVESTARSRPSIASSGGTTEYNRHGYLVLPFKQELEEQRNQCSAQQQSHRIDEGSRQGV